MSITRKRYAVAGVVPLVVLALAAPSATAGTAAPAALRAAAAAKTPTPADESLRRDLGTYLQDLQGAVNSAGSNPHVRKGPNNHAKDQTAAVSVAQGQLPKLTAEQLEAIHGILGDNAKWAKGPSTLKHAVDVVGPPAKKSAAAARSLRASGGAVRQRAFGIPAGPPPGYLSACSADLGDQQGLFYAYWAAAQVASAANAVASGLPDGVDFTPALIIAAVIFGVANGIAIDLSANLTLAQDCATAVSNTTITTSYPTDPSVPGGYVPASSQISVNTLTTLVGGVKATLDVIQTTTNTTTTTLNTVIKQVGTGQGTANTVLTTTKDLQDRADDLLASVGAPADTSTGTANGLANTINAREDTTLANTAAFQAISVRAEIERNLASPPAPVIGLFALPAAQGGYLETARDITTTTINNMIAAGQPVYTAQSQLAAGNTSLAAKQYEAAYVNYTQAYQSAVK